MALHVHQTYHNNRTHSIYTHLQGLHHFYMGNTARGFAYLFSIGGFGVFWIADLVLIPSYIRQVNSDDTPRAKGMYGQIYLQSTSLMDVVIVMSV